MVMANLKVLLYFKQVLALKQCAAQFETIKCKKCSLVNKYHKYSGTRQAIVYLYGWLVQSNLLGSAAFRREREQQHCH